MLSAWIGTNSYQITSWRILMVGDSELFGLWKFWLYCRSIAVWLDVNARYGFIHGGRSFEGEKQNSYCFIWDVFYRISTSDFTRCPSELKEATAHLPLSKPLALARFLLCTVLRWDCRHSIAHAKCSFKLPSTTIIIPNHAILEHHCRSFAFTFDMANAANTKAWKHANISFFAGQLSTWTNVSQVGILLLCSSEKPTDSLNRQHKMLWSKWDEFLETQWSASGNCKAGEADPSSIVLTSEIFFVIRFPRIVETRSSSRSTSCVTAIF